MKKINSLLLKKARDYAKARSTIPVSRSILLHEKLHPYAKIVYLVLCSLLKDGESTVETKQSILSKYSNLSGSSFSRSIKQLSDLRLISIQRQGNKKPNIYKIL